MYTLCFFSNLTNLNKLYSYNCVFFFVVEQMNILPYVLTSVAQFDHTCLPMSASQRECEMSTKCHMDFSSHDLEVFV
jgi:hypothetical protein